MWLIWFFAVADIVLLWPMHLQRTRMVYSALPVGCRAKYGCGQYGRTA